MDGSRRRAPGPAGGRRARTPVHRPPRGRLAGLIDFGDVCGGDPASDLATAWLTLDPSQRAAFRGVLTASGTYDDDAWRRARAWAALLVSALAAGPGSSARFGPVVQHAVRQLDRDATDEEIRSVRLDR